MARVVFRQLSVEWRRIGKLVPGIVTVSSRTGITLPVLVASPRSSDLPERAPDQWPLTSLAPNIGQDEAPRWSVQSTPYSVLVQYSVPSTSSGLRKLYP